MHSCGHFPEGTHGTAWGRAGDSNRFELRNQRAEVWAGRVTWKLKRERNIRDEGAAEGSAPKLWI